MKLLNIFKKSENNSGKKIKTYLQSNGFSSMSSQELTTCWGLRISLDTLYRLKKYNSDIQTGIRIISQKVAMKGLYLTNENWEVLDKNKFKKEYDYINKLFTAQTFNFWKNLFFTNTIISWENYIEPQYNANLRSTKIVKFMPIDSRGMAKLIDDNWNIEWFKQYTTNKVMSFKPEELGYFMYGQDVENENLSMWLLDWIIFDVMWDIEANKTNFYFFKNNAIPNAVFMMDPDMGQEDLEIAIENIKQKYSGSENQHKILVSSAVKDIKTLDISHKDMDFLNQRKFTTDKISSALWIPKELMWYISDSWSYSKIIEIRKEFHQSTITGFESYLENVMNVLINRYSKDLLIPLDWIIIKCDSESIDDRRLIEENQRKDIETGVITINEARQERWLIPFTQEFTNNPLIKTNLTDDPKNSTKTNII